MLRNFPSKLLSVVLLFIMLVSVFVSPSYTYAQSAADELIDLEGTISSDLGTPANINSYSLIQETTANRVVVDPAPHNIVLVLAPRNEAAYAALAEAVQDPTSPRYRQPVTEFEYRQNYAPDPQSLNNIKSYYTSQGLTLDYESTSGLVLSFNGTAAQLDLAFHTTSQFRTNAIGETGRINITPLRVPSSLSKYIKGVLGFDQLHTVQSNSLMVKAARSIASKFSNSAVFASTPASLRTSYNIPNSLTGTGTKVGIIFWGAPSLSDVNRWAAANGIRANVTVLPGGAAAAIDDTLRFEANMDVQMVLTAAPATAIRFYVASNDGYGNLAATIQQAVDDNVNAITNSWGACEKTMTPSIINSYHTIFQNASARGIPVIFSSGDNGAFDCNYGTTTNVGYSQFPASDPLVTSTGATTLERTFSTNVWVNEWAWGCTNTSGSNDAACLQSKAGSSTGGATVNYPRPAFQSNLNPATEARITNTATNTRLQPDISLNGDPQNGQIIFFISPSCSDSCLGGGTSAAAPLLAGIVVLAAQQTGSQVNSFLYKNFSTDWGFDIITGYTGLPARTGWDYTSGNGSIKDVSRFINAFVNFSGAVTIVSP